MNWKWWVSFFLVQMELIVWQGKPRSKNDPRVCTAHDFVAFHVPPCCLVLQDFVGIEHVSFAECVLPEITVVQVDCPVMILCQTGNLGIRISNTGGDSMRALCYQQDSFIILKFTIGY